MGQKRSYDEEGLQELSFKHPKQLDCTGHATSLPEIDPSNGASQKTDSPGNVVGNFSDSQSRDDVSNADSEFNDKEFKTSAPGSWGTSSTMEEDMGSRTVLYSSVFPELFEFSFPRRNIIQFEDTYSSLLNSSPRKEVPIGPDHQADVPVWDPTLSRKYSIGFTADSTDYSRESIIGSCVIPMPELEFPDVAGKTGNKLDCNCFDAGSVRCVRQHVKEVREELKETIGLEKFVDLGFLEMGEEVANRWTEEEERMFHKVVYSNPVSHGRNFWTHLALEFPSRSKEETVSYYFNVFMLRRRAAQNRSSWLDIDSDDDECRGIGGPFRMEREDDKSAAISFINQDVRVDHGDDSQDEYDDDSSSDGNGDDNDDGDEHVTDDHDDGEMQVGEVDVTDNMEGKYHSSKGNSEYSLDDRRFNHAPHDLAKSLGSFRGLPDVQENSFGSFKIQPCVTGSHHPINERASFQGTKVNGAGDKLLNENGDRSTDKFGSQYALESCESKVWDVTYPVGLMTSFDLLPTCNMMEEIFGPCNWNKSSNDKSVS